MTNITDYTKMLNYIFWQNFEIQQRMMKHLLTSHVVTYNSFSLVSCFHNRHAFICVFKNLCHYFA